MAQMKKIYEAVVEELAQKYMAAGLPEEQAYAQASKNGYEIAQERLKSGEYATLHPNI